MHRSYLQAGVDPSGFGPAKHLMYRPSPVIHRLNILKSGLEPGTARRKMRQRTIMIATTHVNGSRPCPNLISAEVRPPLDWCPGSCTALSEVGVGQPLADCPLARNSPEACTRCKPLPAIQVFADAIHRRSRASTASR